MAKKDLDKETMEIMESFIAETNDLLDDSEKKIHDLEKEDYKETVHTVFRMFHSIKGSAGYLNLNNIKSLTHEAETLLDFYRKNLLKPESDDLDILFKTCDLLREMIVKIEKVYNDNSFNKETDDIVCLIKDRILIVNIKLKKLNDSVINKNNANDQNSNSKKFDDLITPQIVEKFISESINLIDKSEKDILDFEKDINNFDYVSSVFRNIHTIKGNAGFIGFDIIESKSMELENYLDNIRNKKIGINKKVISIILTMIDEISKMIDFIKIDEKAKEIKFEYIKKLTSDEKIYKPIGEILIEMGAANIEHVDKAIELQQSKIGEILIDKGVINESQLMSALDKQSKTNPIQDSSGLLINKRKEVRINMEKLDKLFELTGELVTAEAMVINNPDLKNVKLEGFEKAAKYLSKITRDMQEISLSLRMIPLEGIFTKTLRLVRDLSNKANKKVNLIISGEDTEMDRKIIEELSDPIMHIIRNSIDHGIEDKETRLKLNKKETATINLSAKYEGTEIWILIKDDGKGLDREKIINKAVEKKIFEGDPVQLTDEEVWQFVLLPGFSTADKITDISGRGVGMDVVKKNLEKIKGKVEIKSEKNKGTEITLKIPLTMAIIDVITVKVQNNVYSIPLVDILEFFQTKEDQITKLSGKKEVIKLRNEVIPVIKLYEYFKIKTDRTNLTDGIVIVTQRDNKKACIFIEEIIGNQQVVIKMLSESFGKARGLSGCSILGNGEVSLILDIGAIIKDNFE